MSLDLHTTSIAPGGAVPTKADRVQLYTLFGVANGAGGGAGQAVSVAVSVAAAVGLPASNYFVDVELSQDATYYISSKSATGFTVNILPRLAANTLASGTFNVSVQF